jgi:hypothetical protein
MLDDEVALARLQLMILMLLAQLEASKGQRAGNSGDQQNFR